MHTCYQIYGYFQFFTYHLSSVVHSAPLKWYYAQFYLKKVDCLDCNCYIYFRRLPYACIMTNKWQCYLLILRNKNCWNTTRLPHSFYILKVKCISIFLFIYIFMLQFCGNSIWYWSMNISYKIYNNFELSFSSVAHKFIILKVTIWHRKN